MTINNSQLSPAELSYIHTSLSLNPPIRPDGRSPTQFRPVVAETDILPGTNGSARVCFTDGTEAIAGVKLEVEKTLPSRSSSSSGTGKSGIEGTGTNGVNEVDEAEWVEISIDIPGLRDDDTLPVFLAEMLREAILAPASSSSSSSSSSSGSSTTTTIDEDMDFLRSGRLTINGRFHWRLWIDVRYKTIYQYIISLFPSSHLSLFNTRSCSSMAL